jgi:glycosyltransferase involved in cell wall biosynthesis
VGDKMGWSLNHDMRELIAIGNRLGVDCHACHGLRGIFRQCVFFAEIRDTFDYWIYRSSNRIAGAYFHGKPGVGSELDDRNFQGLRRQHHRIGRLQVTNTLFRDVILESGIEPSKVHLIPIGVNLDYFNLQTPESRRSARTHYGIPESALVVGSFQKDGQGWKEGHEPKLIKGPDVFLRALEILKPHISELFVLLSGPARGYVKRGLHELDIPYKQVQLEEYPEVGRLFQCLDLYIVASREEGGPKAVLETMASGVPLVSTRVGQAADLIEHGQNGWLAEVGDAEALAHWAKHAIERRPSLEPLVKAARRTAERNSYEALVPFWRAFLAGFVSPLQPE